MIEIGSTLFLELKEISGDNEVCFQYRCRLIDRESSAFLIDYPINQHTLKPKKFLEGAKFTASFLGKDNAIYEFETEVIGRKRNNIPMLLLQEPEKDAYVRIQRRNYVRVETSLNAAVHSMDGEFPPFVSTSLDLSGGGCLVVIPSSKRIPNEGQIKLWLVLPMKSGELVYVTSHCKIVRLFKPNNEATERVSLQFIDISERERQKIIRYCFERQSTLRRMKK